MSNTIELPCDGCGRAASAEHLARRLQRLEWTTRYRPVHINTLLLSAVSPPEERDFLYSPKGEFHGEAALLLEALGLSAAGRTRDAVHAEFQRAGFFLAHILECPLENDSESQADRASLLAARLAAVAARIRRSLRPQRVVLISQELEPILESILSLELSCPIVLDRGKPFQLDSSARRNAVAWLRDTLSAPAMD
jgi:hypothetical protein